MGRPIRSINVDVDIDFDMILDDLTDEEIIEEARERGLVVQEIKTKDGSDTREAAVEVLEWLFRRQPDRALEKLNKLLALLVPAELLEAQTAMQQGRVSDAICLIDKVAVPHNPSASADAFNLQRKLLANKEATQ